MKYIQIISLTAFLLVVSISCSEDNPDIQNYINFENTQEENTPPIFGKVDILDIKHNSVTINWDFAEDQENDKIFYNLYFEDKAHYLGMGKDQVYTINNLEESTFYEGYLEVTDSITAPVNSHFSFKTKKYYLTFDKLIGSNNDIPFSPSIMTSDGGIIVAGNVYFEGHNCLGFTKIDSCGYIQWNRKFLDYMAYGTWTDHDLVRTNDQGFVYCSNRSVIKVNAIGDMLWSYPIPSEVYDNGIIFTTLIEKENSDIIVLGRGSDSKTYKTKLTGDGEFIWGKYEGVFPVGSAVKLRNSNYAILERITENYVNEYYLSIVNDEGSKIESFNINDGRTNFLQKVIQTSDNGYIVLSNSWDSRNTSSIRVIKLSERGNIEWDQLYKYGSYGSTAYDIIENRDSQYVIVGYNEFSQDEKALILVLGKSGGVMKNKEYSPDYMDYVWVFSFIAQTNDGGYFIKGGKGAVWNFSGKPIGRWLLKTDNEFNVDK